MALYKHIPNTITSMNLLSGIMGVIFALEGHLEWALPMMVLAAVFDFCDGLAARLLDAHSPIGGELDSLADLVSFGVLPSLMLYKVMPADTPVVVRFLPLFVAVMSAVRLAKFNVDDRQTRGFLGLPTPAAALLCGALCCYCCHAPVAFLSTWVAGPVFVPLLSVILSALLVCEIPMFSFKMHKDDSRMLQVKRMTLVAFILAAVVFCLVAGHHWSLAVLLGFLFYVLNNLVYALFKL